MKRRVEYLLNKINNSKVRSLIDNIGLTLLEIIAVILPGAFLMEILSNIKSLSEFKVYLHTKDINLLTGLLLFGVAYFLGHVLYSISSTLDDVYDWIKLYRLGYSKKELRGLKLMQKVQYQPNRTSKWPKLFPFSLVRDSHNLVQKVIEIKLKSPDYHYYKPDVTPQLNEHDDRVTYAGTLMNAYQYSFRRLLLEAPSMSDEVQRYYATAKFFRSMVLVLFIAFILSLWYPDQVPNNLLWAGLALVSILVYFNRWSKAIRVAMKNLIVLEEMEERKMQ